MLVRQAASIDQYGQFTLRGIPPGKYRLFAWENIEGFQYFDPDLVRRFKSSGEPVTVVEGSQLDLNVQIITTDEKQ